MLSRLRFAWRLFRLAVKLMGGLWISVYTFARGDQTRTRGAPTTT